MQIGLFGENNNNNNDCIIYANHYIIDAHLHMRLNSTLKFYMHKRVPREQDKNVNRRILSTMQMFLHHITHL